MKKILLIVSSLFLLLLFSCAPAQTQCSADTDCAPAICCHADTAVNEQYAPSCNGVLCTMECRPGTIDCGQGSIQCVQNKCIVVLNEQ